MGAMRGSRDVGMQFVKILSPIAILTRVLNSLREGFEAALVWKELHLREVILQDWNLRMSKETLKLVNS